MPPQIDLPGFSKGILSVECKIITYVCAYLQHLRQIKEHKK